MRVSILFALASAVFVSLTASCGPQIADYPTADSANPPPTSASPAVTSTPPTSSTVSLQSISIDPASPEPLRIGSVQDFKATGHYSDGSTRDISDLVTWASSDASVASMYPYGGAFAESAGTTHVTATLQGVISAAATVSVPPNDTALLVYIDASYTVLWDETNEPDLSSIVWEPAPSEGSPYAWVQGILVVYLRNAGDRTLQVNAEDNLRAVRPGISVGSDVVTIPPGERTRLEIVIKQSPEVLRMWGSSGGFNVWFNIVEQS